MKPELQAEPAPSRAVEAVKFGGFTLASAGALTVDALAFRSSPEAGAIIGAYALPLAAATTYLARSGLIRLASCRSAG